MVNMVKRERCYLVPFKIKGRSSGSRRRNDFDGGFSVANARVLMNNPSMKVARQIEDAVFLAAQDLSDLDARRQFLDKACAGDDALRTAVVEGMQGRAGKFFQKRKFWTAVDKWAADTLDYQACGVVLVESHECTQYQQFCEATVNVFGTTTNGAAAGRIFKTCLLPQKENLMEQLRPLGELAEAYLLPQDSKALSGWAAIPVSLWRYRLGDYEKTAEWCCREIGERDTTTEQLVTLRILLAMSSYQSDQKDDARSQPARAREVVERKFKKGLDRGNTSLGLV